MDSKAFFPLGPFSATSPANGVASTRRPSGTHFAPERREDLRIDVQFDVSVGSDSHYFTAQACDLSSRGLFLATYRALPAKGELSIEFDLPAGRVVAQAMVRWVRAAREGRCPGYGVELVKLSQFNRTLIESFCRSQLGVPSERCALAG